MTANDEKRINMAMHCHGDVKLDNVVLGGGDMIDLLLHIYLMNDDVIVFQSSTNRCIG